MTTQRTPGKLHVVENEKDGTYWVVTEGQVVARLDTRDPFSPIAKADAAFIVEACNAHDSLVSERDAFRDALEKIADSVGCVEGDIARAALSAYRSRTQ